MCISHLPSRIGAAVAALLLVSAATVCAADQKDTKDTKNTHAQHQQSHEAPQHEQQQQQQVQHHEPPPQQQQQVQHHEPPPQQQQQQQMHTAPPQQNPGRQFGGQQQQNQQQNPGRQFGRQPDNQPQHFGGSQPQHNPPANTGYTPRPGIRAESGPGNRQIYHAPNGGQVHMDHGRVVEVHTSSGAIIHHGPEGYRRVEYVRPGGRTVVINNYGGGYVQHTLVISNHSFVQRTYVVNGVVTTRVYRPFLFGGVSLAIYTPAAYYRPGFYVYAYNPWMTPVYYNSWGWAGRPWFGFYTGYWAPAPSYPSPAYWLTDYIIGAVLQDAYQERTAANLSMSAGYYSGAPGFTPDVREAVAAEVGRQLRQEEAEAATGGNGNPMSPFTGGTHIFVAGNTVEGMAGIESCAITGGDVLEMRGAPPMGATVPVMVRAGKRGGCPRGAVVMVAVQDLVDMQNHMREVMDRGLAELQHRHGQGGLPPMPAEAAAPPTQTAWASQVRPDVGAEAELNQVSSDANRAEQDTVNSTVQGGSPEPVAPPPSDAGAPAQPAAAQIGVGSSIDDVVAAWGQPLRSADLGGKKIYIYKDVKVTFQDGKVIDVQ